MAENLIIYYSRAGQNYVNGAIEDLPVGNTKVVVEFIKNAVGAGVFEVKTVKPYSADYTTCTEEAKKELREGARPELASYLENLDGYKNVFVCGPCWWGTYPMAIFSQLERLDWEDKVVLPLMTHEGSGLGHCTKDLWKICKGATIGEGLAVHGGDAAESQQVVSTWAKRGVETRR